MYECCVEGMKFEEFFDGEVAHTIAGMMHVYFIPLQHNLLTAGVVQLNKRQSAVQKATGWNSCHTNTPGPCITEEKVLPL